MAGVKGAGGPIPKRASQRRRTNKESVPETVVLPAVDVIAPPADDAWHDAARAWYESLADSGQSTFYEPSDWAVAYLIAESISRDLKPQVVGIHPETGEPVRARIPMKGASLSSYLKAMTSLLVTEGDRRRARLELERAPLGDGDSSGRTEVAELDDYRRRLSG